MKRYAVGIDIGGTFTDVTMSDLTSNQVWNVKTPTTPNDPSQGFVVGLTRIIEIAGIEADEVAYVFHGTTIGTNAILENRGARTALVTTQGFRYVLEIGRHDIPRRANMFAWQKPERPVPPRRIFEIRESVTVDGVEIDRVDEEEVRGIARELGNLGVESVAICLINSYANAQNEQLVRDILRRELPACTFSISSEVLPVFREYERSMATVLNAFIQPLVGEYVGRLRQALLEIGVDARLSIMKSNGGVISADLVRDQPIHTSLSGPAAGVIGANFVGQPADARDLITLDIGGTSADVSLIIQGEVLITNEGRVGSWPTPIPMIDIQTIGAGGGSIARVTEEGTPVVGPESAGASPGPACYGYGTEPTVTDANLVLGRIPPHLLGGEIRLDTDAAFRAIEERLAKPLGLSVEEAALGILDIVNNNMVGAIRLVTIERGYDPRDFALVPFGGAGPLHSGQIAELLDIRTVIVPRSPGVLSTFGLLATDLRNDYARTNLQEPPNYDCDAMAAIYRDLESQAGDWFGQEGITHEHRTIQRQADLRYKHQGFEITVPWNESETNEESVLRLLDAFHDRHEQMYTFSHRDAPVEIVTLRVNAVGALQKLQPVELNGTGSMDAVSGSREVYFGGVGTYIRCTVYDRVSLPVGFEIEGPAIIEQPDSTVVIEPSQSASIDSFGNVIVTRG